MKEKSEKLKEYQEMLKNGVKGVLTSQKWEEYLKMQSSFHKYSFNNTIMILVQKPNASLVASYKKWQERKRFVNKGERAIKIFAPMFKKEEDENGNERDVLFGFRMVNVFDISQTTGEELPGSICKSLDGSSEQAKFIIEILKNKVIDIPVVIEEMGTAKGYFAPKANKIALNSNNEDIQNAKTLMHECGHYWVRKKGLLEEIETLAKDSDEFKGLKDAEEIIVESVAFIVGQHFGLDTSEYSFEYIASWSLGNVDSITRAGSIIQRLAKEMIEAIENAHIEEEAEKISA